MTIKAGDRVISKTWACLGCDKTFATLEACERHEAKCIKGGPRT